MPNDIEADIGELECSRERVRPKIQMLFRKNSGGRIAPAANCGFL